MSALELIDLARSRGLLLWVYEGRLRFAGPHEALDDLALDLQDAHAEILELLRGVLLGEPDRTEAAPWPCSCCGRFYTEDDLGGDGWCPVCEAAIDRACADLQTNPAADVQTLGEKAGLSLRRFLGRG